MSTESHPASDPAPAGPRWQPLSPTDRRVVGVLIEKAKTTPDQYPLTLNALTNGCNQKNNRDPVTNLTIEDIEASIERLRPLGAVALVHGGGRVSKCRHYMYDWLGVDKVELAVMAELLLRGPQTVGELRGRAARMEPIADLAALRPVLESLKAKNLIVPLTPEGRGHIVTHALYPPDELTRVRARHQTADLDIPPPPRSTPTQFDQSGSSPTTATTPRPQVHSPSPTAAEISPNDQRALENQMAELRAQIEELRTTVDDLTRAVDDATAELAELKRDLGT